MPAKPAIGAPFWLGLVVLLALASLVAPVPSLIVVGRRLSKGRLSAFAAFALTAIPLGLVWFVPYVRGLVFGGLVIVGIGAIARGAMASRGGLGWASGVLREAEPRRRRRRRKPTEQPAEDGESPTLYAVDGEKTD